MNPVTFITGASGGIGRACALKLAAEGFDIAGTYFSDEKSAAELETRINSAGGRCRMYKLDVSDPAQVKTVTGQVEADFGGIYAAVNCAGAALNKLFQDTSDDDFERINGINFKGVFNVCRECTPLLLKNHKGCIINISSMWGIKGASCEVLYSATKAAIIGLTKALARELAPSGIRVNCIAPGAVDTKMNDNLTPADKAVLCEEIPLSRFGTAQEIAEVVTFLASEKSSYITAQVITADGGLI